VDIGDSSTQARRLAFCDLAEVIWMPYPLTCVEKTPHLWSAAAAAQRPLFNNLWNKIFGPD
jgi:hypothetical protein